ncbi:hypothetical protein DFJ74DRAFT_308375 [Hyaloraphidium curvatum]|nr:hypothetical protein DFJ74DRAFT_308375 [Hyaloraphidium curvatum]
MSGRGGGPGDPGDTFALHVPSADLPGLFHSLRIHPSFRRLVVHPDGSAHVVASPDPANWASLRQLVGVTAVPDPSFRVHPPPPPPPGPPSAAVALRFFALPRHEIERFLLLFPGVVAVDVARAPGPGAPVGEAVVRLSSEDYARHLLETITQATNWEAVYVRGSEQLGGPPPGQGMPMPNGLPLGPAPGVGGHKGTVGPQAAAHAAALAAAGQPLHAAASQTFPGALGRHGPPGMPTRNDHTEVQVTLGHPPGTPKEQVGNWVVGCVPGLENIIWIAPSGEPDPSSTAALLRFHAPQFLQAFLAAQPLQEGVFSIAVASVPVPIISVPASTPAPNFSAGAGGPRDPWGPAARDRDQFRRDRSAGSGSEDRDYSRERPHGARDRPYQAAPRTTLQLTSIPQHLDRADLRRFSRSLAGFKKIAFYRDWCFLVFVSAEAAHAAMRIVNDGTVGFLGGMRASFTKENYLQKHPPPPSGPPNPTLYVTNLPFNANPNEFRRLFSDFEGFQDAYFFRGSCKVYFRDTESADRTRKELNEETNLVATFWSGGGGFAASATGTSAKTGSETGSARGGSERGSDRGSENAASEDGEGSDDEDEGYSNKMASSVGSLASSHAASGRPPRATIHITNLSVANAPAPNAAGPGTSHDKADLLQLLSSFPGFVRVAFYRDWVFAVFSTPQQAAEAIDRLHRETKMRASYAREEYSPNYIVPDAGSPCPVLYVCNLPWDATNLELTKIFKMYEGFREVYFFREACKVYFEDTARAKKCLEDLNVRTNLIATFFKGEAGFGTLDEEGWEDETKAVLAANLGALGLGPGPAGYGSAKADPKSTLHVSNLTKDRAELKQLFSGFDGFSRIAFYPNWVFVVFKDVASAGKAIEQIHATTRMQAAFAQIEYAAPFVRPEVGEPSKIVRVGNFPSNAIESEFVKLFRSYPGSTGEVRFGREDCHVWFQTVEQAKACVEDINARTNLCAVFYPAAYPMPGANGRPMMPTGIPGSLGSASSGGFSAREERLEFWEDDEQPISVPSPGTSDSDYLAGPGRNGEVSGGLLQSSGSHAPKVTLKIGNITMDRADIRRMLSSLDGFQRIAFYRDYIYACFATMEHARRAMDWIHLNTRMRCVFPKYDYTSRNDKTDTGLPCPILHVSNLPFNATPGEFVKLLSVYEGYRDVQFFRESCLVFFSSAEEAARAARDLNETTNLIAVFSKKGLAALNATQQQAQIQASIATSPLFQEKGRANTGGAPDMRSLATIGLGFLFANDARFEGVTASTLGLNTPVAMMPDQRAGLDPAVDMPRRSSNAPPPGAIGSQRPGGNFFLPPQVENGLLGGAFGPEPRSLFSTLPGDRGAQDDDWLEQRRRSAALADEIVGFDDNTEDARYGFGQFVEPWDADSGPIDAFGRAQPPKPSLLGSKDRASDPPAASNLLVKAGKEAGTVGSGDLVAALSALDINNPSIAPVLQALPDPAKQYIAALKSLIADLETKLTEANSELDLLRKKKPSW